MELMKRYPDKYFDLAIVDPPYGIGAENHAGNADNGWKQWDKKSFISLELFEYCGKNFIKDEQDSKNQLIFGFQNFINRSFDDFGFLDQEKSQQIF